MSNATPSPPPPAPRGQEIAQIKARFIAAIQDATGGPGAGSGCSTAIVFAILATLSLTIVLIPLAWKLYNNWRNAGRVRSVLDEALAFAERAEPVMAFPLMVNSMLRRPGHQPAPGLVIIGFGSHGESMTYMSEVALTIERGTRSELASEDSRFCQALMDDEQYVPFRRRRIPTSITGGPAVYACDLGIHPLLLHGRHISDEMPLIACMAEPGEQGMILQIPYWHVAGTAPPADGAKAAFLLMIASLPELRKMASANPSG